MSGIQIKIAGEWLALPEDFSISLEQSNPLFNDQGTFSFPFEIPLEPNRHIFKNVDDPFGYISLADIDKMEAEVWFDGVMLYRGIIETDEEIDFEDSLPVTFLSGNSDFMSRIEGMNAKDVPLDREIKLGYRVKYASGVAESHGESMAIRIGFPDDFMKYTEVNVSDPYPIKPYCNVRVCTSDENGNYVTLEAERSYSGVCFYVLYLLDCLFLYLGVSVRKNDLLEIEDMCRLAFFTTKCDITEKLDDIKVSLEEVQEIVNGTFEFFCHYHSSNWSESGLWAYSMENMSYYARNVYATSQNYPDVEIDNLLEDLKNAFGVRTVFDTYTNTVSLVLIKNILKDKDIKGLDINVLDVSLTRRKPKSITLTYGNDDDTSFNYDDWSNVEESLGYLDILRSKISSFNTTCYIDIETGNAYRIKVNEKSGGDPSLFEVGGFRDYTIGDEKSENVEELSINFSPVIINDVNGSNVLTLAKRGIKGEQVFAVFANVTLKSDTKVELKPLPLIMAGTMRPNFEFFRVFRYEAKENYDRSNENESPLRNYDAGYILGIMRGPGNNSGLETVTENYDGEGNDTWVQTVGSYAFTSDSCDNFGRFFDYNGTEEGGADQSGRFSLKLIAGKEGYPIGEKYADRGLVNKFLSEYLYFLANRRTVTLTVKMSITQIIGIDFLKKYRIGEFVGFINKISYTLGVNGLEDIQIEMYII